MRTKAYFDRFAEKLDELAWGVDTAPWAAWAWERVAEEVGPAPGALIVDLGTGTGAAIRNLLRTTEGARFLGVDFSESMIARARSWDWGDAQVEFRICRVDELELPPVSVDFFVSSGTFHHIKNKFRVARRLVRMLRPAGRLINVDHFRAGPVYRAEMEALRAANPEATAENDRVRREFQWLYDQDENHPIEFHTDPYEFCSILQEGGFVDTRVFVSLQPDFAVVSASAPTLLDPGVVPFGRH